MIRGAAAPTPAPSDNQILTAALWMVGAILSFSAMAVAGRNLSSELDTFEINMYRSIIGFVIVLIVARTAGTLGQVNRQRLGLHFTRNIVHYAGQNLWFFAIATVPLAQVFALEFSSPIWVTLAAPFFLGERLTAVKLFCALLGFFGILIVARPDFGNLQPDLVSAALAAIGFAGSAVFTKMLTRTASLTCILFWLTLMQSGFGVITAGIDGDIAVPSAALLPWLGVVGVTGLLAHYCLTSALSVAPATIVMPFDFLRLPVIAVVGMVLFNETVDAWVFVGAVVIFGANYLNIWTAGRRPRAPVTEGRRGET